MQLRDARESWPIRIIEIQGLDGRVSHSRSGPLKTQIKHSTSAVSWKPTRIKDSKLSRQISQCCGPPKTRMKHSTSAVSCILTRIKDSDKSSRDNLTVPRPAKNSDKALNFSCNLQIHSKTRIKALVTKLAAVKLTRIKAHVTPLTAVRPAAQSTSGQLELEIVQQSASG